MKRLQWADPATVEEALALLGKGAVAKGGGVDLADRLKEGLDAPERIVNLRRVAGLDGLEERDGALDLGPLVTLSRLAEDAAVRARWPALAEAALRAGTPNVRSQATVGGNLLQRPRCAYFRQEGFPCLRKGGTTCFAREGRNAWHAVLANDPCAMVHPSDAATALVAYRATAEIAGPRGRRTLAVEELFVRPEEDVAREHRVGPDELLVALRVPAPPPGTGSAYLKLVERESADWPLGAVAAVIEAAAGRCERASIVLGAAAPVPWRAREAEVVLAGRALDERTASQAARAALAAARPLSENGYKVRILEVAVKRAVLAAAGAKA
ncbi:MAG TPA: FAD binding domain-containing protein [Anaeromyxobacteraceae bacterium]|nr:FAD binding domain-containing protein [Anaeromyxobacteraceae bacterium]